MVIYTTHSYDANRTNRLIGGIREITDLNLVSEADILAAIFIVFRVSSGTFQGSA
jgi:hypothetical protein